MCCNIFVAIITFFSKTNDIELESVLLITLIESFECVLDVEILGVESTHISIVWLSTDHAIPLISVDLLLFLSSLLVDLISFQTTMDEKFVVVCLIMGAKVTSTQEEFIRGFIIDCEPASATLS